MDISWAYTGYIAFFGVVWGGLYLWRPDLRNEMLAMSLLAMPLGPVGDFFYRADYYNLPNLNGEFWWLFSAGVGFVYGGVTAVLYEELFREKHAARRNGKRTKPHMFWFISVAVIGCIFMVSVRELIAVNSMYSSLIVMLVGGSLVFLRRPDLWREAVGSGLALMTIATAYYVVALQVFPGLFDQWNHSVLLGIHPLGIPIEEYAWHFAWGFIAGPAYEYARGVWLRT